MPQYSLLFDQDLSGTQFLWLKVVSIQPSHPGFIVRLPVGVRSYVEYILTVFQLNQGVYVQTSRRANLRESDFPVSISGLPAGSYVARVDGVSEGGATETIVFVTFGSSGT